MNTSRTSPLSRIQTIARRELKALVDHPTGYVLLVVFVAVNDFLYFRQAFLNGVASLRPMMDLLPWVYLFIVPAVSMRTLAEDLRAGMTEVVLTQPVTELELLVGKYCGAVLFLWLALALTFPIPLGLTLGARLQWGPVVAQYVGAALLAGALSGVGVWASSLTRSQITAFILAVGVMFIFILVGLDPLIVGLPPAAAALAARLGVLSHFEGIGRGVIDVRDVIYFISLAGVFLLFAYGVLLGRKLSHTGAARRRLRTGVLVAAVSVLIVNLLGGYIGGRLDLSPGRAYTLSSATRQLVRNLDDIVTIKVFASDELPTSVALLKRDLDDMLRDLRSAAHGKIRVIRRNTTTDQVAQRDAQADGVQPVQFNTVGASELQVKEGYLGLAIQYGAGNEAIPFVNRTDDLEFRVASSIRALTRGKKQVVGIVTGALSGGAVGALRGELSKEYDVHDIGLSDATQPGLDVAALVLIGTPDSVPVAAADRLRAFFRRGGGALVLANGSVLSQQAPMATPRAVAWNDILAPFGVAVRSDIVYDLAANEMVPARTSGPFQVMRPYPFLVRASSTTKSTVNKDLTTALMPWASSIDTTHSAQRTITPLFVTSNAAGVSTAETVIDPGRNDYSRSDLATRLVAVQVMPAADTGVKGRVIVVGNAEFINDNFAQHAPENLAFALNAVDWLAQDASLIAIRSRDTRPPPIAFTSTALRDGVKYGNTVGVPLLVALAGLVHLVRRRRRSRAPYQPGRVPMRSPEAIVV